MVSQLQHNLFSSAGVPLNISKVGFADSIKNIRFAAPCKYNTKYYIVKFIKYVLIGYFEDANYVFKQIINAKYRNAKYRNANLRVLRDNRCSFFSNVAFSPECVRWLFGERPNNIPCGSPLYMDKSGRFYTGDFLTVLGTCMGVNIVSWDAVPKGEIWLQQHG